MTTEETNTSMANLENVEAAIALAQAEAKKLQDQIVVMKRQLARGTGDVTVEAAKAVAKPTIMARIEEVIKTRPAPADELTKTLGEASDKIQAALKAARTTGRLRNIGPQERPVWFWRPGPDAAPKEVREAVLGLISHQPMTFVELKNVTGAKDSTVQGALIEIRRSGIMVHNLGTAARARYFVVPEGALDARLQPKGK